MSPILPVCRPSRSRAKRIENTLIYTHLVRFSDEEYVSAVAKTVDEARQLVEAGFEYVTAIDGIRLFRKRK